VRSLVCIVVMIVTVMHFMFGCCLHASHACADEHDCCTEHDTAPSSDFDHDCSGCTCAATVEGDSSDMVQPPAVPPSALWAPQPLPVSTHGKSRPKDRGGPPLSSGSHPLHERLLV
jgi:hypothetical protein